MIKMNNGKNKVIVYLCAIIFGVLGVYLTFFAGNTDKYDSQTSAYKIEPNERFEHIINPNKNKKSKKTKNN